MENGAIQEMTTSLSEVSFVRYDLPLDALTGSPGATTDSLNQTPSTALIAASLAGDAPDGTLDALARRSLEALRVVAICLFVAALAAFPSGRRRTGDHPHRARRARCGIHRAGRDELPRAARRRRGPVWASRCSWSSPLLSSSPVCGPSPRPV